MKSLSEVIIYRDLTNKGGESTLDDHSLIYLIYFFVNHNANLLKKIELHCHIYIHTYLFFRLLIYFWTTHLSCASYYVTFKIYKIIFTLK